MDLIRRIVAEAPAHMSEDAVLVIEVGHERRRFEAVFPRLECAWLETSGGNDCVVLVERQALAR
jgi:ribosomal protein L3 glutamine methyltransferase